MLAKAAFAVLVAVFEGFVVVFPVAVVPVVVLVVLGSGNFIKPCGQSMLQAVVLSVPFIVA